MKNSSKEKSLIIVESPTKARTIQNFLGDRFSVLSSYGHIRDLPKTKIGIDLENSFQPQFVISKKTKKTVNLLKSAAKKSKKIILATDEDREGESIAFHLREVLNIKENYERIVFHEITKDAIERALKNPRAIDMDLVFAQFGRRILDRIVGYKLSPFLWKKVAKNLSAGRVQSVATRLIVEREREISSFVPQEYWSIKALFQKIQTSRPCQDQDEQQKSEIQNEFEALLVKKNGGIIPKFAIKTKEKAESIIGELDGAEYKIKEIVKKEIGKNPLPPFTTSTLQQEGWKRLRFSAKKIMSLAQKLYEQGLITYHRTDSFNLSHASLVGARNFILKNIGKNYWKMRKFKTKSRTAQEAHEAIRPTYPDQSPEKITSLEKSMLDLYSLVWKRFIASQMQPAIFNFQKAEIEAKNYAFQATGQSLKFDGFLKIYPLVFKEKQISNLEKNEVLSLKKITPQQHFTQPPSRYTEATLIKALEEKGIGRPSTYAPIISTIQERNYVQKIERGNLIPTEIGFLVNDLLVEHFPKIVDINFTAKLEKELDEIAQGKIRWQDVISNFYAPFKENLDKKEREISKEEIAQEKTDKNCPSCGGQLIIRIGRFGKFYACNGFPKCRYTAPIDSKRINIKCPKCKIGEIVEKRTKKRKIFYGCSKYPDCDFATWNEPIKEFCEKCKWVLVKIKKGQKKCSNPECFNLEKKIKN